MVYLLHFTEALSHARHYIGYTDVPVARLQVHLDGKGARILQVIGEKGITFSVVRLWDQNKRFERRLKNQKNTWRLCPVCNPKGYKSRMGGDIASDLIDQAVIDAAGEKGEPYRPITYPIPESIDPDRYWMLPDGEIVKLPSKNTHADIAEDFIPTNVLDIIRQNYDENSGHYAGAVMDAARTRGYLDFVVDDGVLWIRKPMEDITIEQYKRLIRFSNKSGGLQVQYDKKNIHG